MSTDERAPRNSIQTFRQTSNIDFIFYFFCVLKIYLDQQQRLSAVNRSAEENVR